MIAGKETMPVIVRDMDDDAAIILMVDSNLQRETILPSERAFAYKMKLEAIKRQGKRNDLTSDQIGPKLTARQQIAKDVGAGEVQVSRFIRLRSLEDGYKEDDIRKRIHGKCTKAHKELKLNLLINIQEKIINKGEAYERWATNFNLKQISKTLLFLRAHEITSMEDLNKRVDSSIDHFNQLSDDIKAKEKRTAEIQVLKKHIFNYSDTRGIYVEYRKSGYSKKYLESHREQILIHKAAKDAFNDLGCKKIPKVKE